MPLLSYLEEALECNVAGPFKAAVEKLTSLGKPVSRELNDWKIKTVSEALRALLDS